MTSVTALTLNALNADQARIERVAANLANVQTPGYKREVVVERVTAAGDFAQAMARAERSDPPAGQGALASIGALPMLTVARDMKSGTMKTTGRALDLALSGPGVFEVATEHGPAYTRRGEFQVDALGRVVTPQGHALMGLGGEIELTQDRPRIDSDGRVFDGERQVAQLRILDVPADQLRSLGDGLYASDGAVREMPSGLATVRQGFIENANVDPAHEMVSLTTTARHFEALLRVAQSRDEMLGTAIRKLGEA